MQGLDLGLLSLYRELEEDLYFFKECGRESPYIDFFK
jgi:hypothetical protein